MNLMPSAFKDAYSSRQMCEKYGRRCAGTRLVRPYGLILDAYALLLRRGLGHPHRLLQIENEKFSLRGMPSVRTPLTRPKYDL
jgi:hypothetical protein